jgi:sulfatase modifying factor 1
VRELQAKPTNPAITSNSIGLSLVQVPAGEFLMGSAEPATRITEDFPGYGKPPEYFADEYPQHRVRISHSFWLGKYEVTVAQFRAFVNASGYRTEAERDGFGGWGYDPQSEKCSGRHAQFNWKNPGFKVFDQQPVVNVSWNDATAFCAWLSQKEHRHYRLPTEAEWEYADRAGTELRYSNSNDAADLAKFAHILDLTRHAKFGHVQDLVIAPDDPTAFPEAVGLLLPNQFGLYDMHGNVWEWVSDWYGESYYSESPTNDPQGPTQGDVHVRRGGGWNSFPIWARSSFRNWNTPESRCVNLGFRVARE